MFCGIPAFPLPPEGGSLHAGCLMIAIGRLWAYAAIIVFFGAAWAVALVLLGLGEFAPGLRDVIVVLVFCVIVTLSEWCDRAYLRRRQKKRKALYLD